MKTHCIRAYTEGGRTGSRSSLIKDDLDRPKLYTEAEATAIAARLTVSNNVYEAMMKLPKSKRTRVHFMSPGKDRSTERARNVYITDK